VSLIVEELNKMGIEYKTKFPMNKFTSLRVGGMADFAIYPSSSEELRGLINLLNELSYPWLVLGAGSNTIILDEGINKAVIITKKMRGFEISDEGILIAEAGANMGTILNQTLKTGYTGFEFAAGIPGTIGGGVYMNAGANGGEIKDVLEKIWVYIDGKEEIIEKSDIRFEYRKSNLPKDAIVLKASFKLQKGNIIESASQVKNYLEKRSKTQPIAMSNTGSIFKNPKEIPAGKLIEELGLKGYESGGAQISEIHANFIVNRGRAKASDVLALIDIAKRTANLQRGIQLETEVRIFG